MKTDYESVERRHSSLHVCNWGVTLEHGALRLEFIYS